MLRWIAILILIGWLAACDGTELTDGKGPTEPNGEVDQGDDGQGEPPTPATVDELLAQIEQAGQDSPAITADIEYHVDQQLTGDSEHRTGSVKYQAAGEDESARFYVGFDTLALGEGPTMADEVEYAFDGRWLTIAKHRIKQMTRYEVAAEGQRIEAFKLGKGPFPLPFGQEADDVIKFFLPTTRPLRDGEPKGAEYLKLVPRPRYLRRMSFVRLEMWIDLKRHLPVKLISRDQPGSITTVAFKNIQTPKSFPAEMFRLPRKAGWSYTEKPLEP